MNIQRNDKRKQTVKLYHSGKRVSNSTFQFNEGCHLVSQTPYDLQGTIVHSHINYRVHKCLVWELRLRTYNKQILNKVPASGQVVKHAG